MQKKLEVKAEPVISKPVEQVEVTPSQVEKLKQGFINKVQPTENNVHNINYKKYTKEDQSLYTPVNIQKTKKNNLYGEFDNSRPPLRDYN